MKLKKGKKSGLKYFTMQDIRSWNPCYDPKRHLPESWRGTAIDILNHSEIPFQDKLWVVLRTEICSDKLMRLFAVFCYRDTLNWIKNPDLRSIEAANVAKRFANGLATREELSAAWSAADSAAWSAADSAAWSAANSEYSAESAARSAAYSAARSAVRSAELAAESAAQERYKNKLIEMIKEEGKERVK